MTTDDYLLLVDDDETAHYLCRRVLGKLEIRVDVEDAMNGEEACRAIERRGPPTLMLLDLRMPCMDGHQVLDWLQSGSPRLPPVVFVLSSSVRIEDRELAERFEFVRAYVEKPLRREAFVPLLREEPTLTDIFSAVPPAASPAARC